MTDAVLGTSATSDGAVCHRISRKGEGYVWTDLSGVFEKFNTPLVRETATIAAGGITLPSDRSPDQALSLPHGTTEKSRSYVHVSALQHR
jgi:hypothetical protein